MGAVHLIAILHFLIIHIHMRVFVFVHYYFKDKDFELETAISGLFHCFASRG